MNFGTKEDIEAPIEFVFGQLSDFNALERSAMRRGADVQRMDNRPTPGVGMAWDVEFDLRGKRRQLQMEVTEFSPPNSMVMTSRSPTMGGHMAVELVALSRARTRMSLEIELQPKNLTARLLIQSLKLAKKNLLKRFHERVGNYAADVEDRYQKSGGLKGV